MQQIRKDHKPFRPDRVVAGAGSDPQIKEHTVVAKSAAFRSRKKWYALSFNCTAAPDHLAVTSFSYTIGEEIPEVEMGELRSLGVRRGDARRGPGRRVARDSAANS